MINAIELARQMYTVYCETVGGKAFNGDALPSWKEFSTDPTKTKQVRAWIDAADRAMDLLAGTAVEMSRPVALEAVPMNSKVDQIMALTQTIEELNVTYELAHGAEARKTVRLKILEVTDELLRVSKAA